MSQRDSSSARSAGEDYRPKGEIWVWATGAGLLVGLLLVVGLLTMIFVNGVTVFWPKRVAEFELRPGSEAGYQGSPRIAGEIVQHRSKIVRRLDDQGKALPEEREYQLFVGNKDVYGFGFKFVDEAEVRSIEFPRDLVVAERLEYGDAIFHPVALELRDGRTLAAEHPEFERTLADLVRQVGERRADILRVERQQIGDINQELEQLRLEERALDREGARPDDGRRARVRERRAALQARYEVLAAEARSLRAAQEENRLRYRLPTGQEQSLALGNIVGFHYPNRMTTGERIGHFAAAFWSFLSDEPREANTEGGIFPAIFGTFVMTLIMSVAVTPFGVLAAIYLREYAKQGLLVRSVRIAVNNLAGVPSIVFGVFGLGFFVYTVGGTIDRLFYSLALPTPTFGTGGILWASLTLALMTVPVVIVATEEALAAVSRGVREGSLACGASKWQTIQRLVLPAALPGILTGLILAMARGAGEVAPLMLVGVVKLAPTLPLDATAPFLHLDRKFMHLGFHIYDLGFQSPDSEAAKPMVFATTFLLIMLVVVLNLGAILLRNHLRKKYLSSAF